MAVAADPTAGSGVSRTQGKRAVAPAGGSKGMDYLAFKLVWWLLGALVFGFVVGWLSCSRSESDPS
jgi:hypothetical protein